MSTEAGQDDVVPHAPSPEASLDLQGRQERGETQLGTNCWVLNRETVHWPWC